MVKQIMLNKGWNLLKIKKHENQIKTTKILSGTNLNNKANCCIENNVLWEAKQSQNLKMHAYCGILSTHHLQGWSVVDKN